MCGNVLSTLRRETFSLWALCAQNLDLFYRRHADMLKNFLNYSRALFISLGVLIMSPISAFAGTAGTLGPLDNTIMVVRNDLTGFWAYTLVTIALVVAGVLLAMGEQGGVVKKLGGVVMGGAIALGSTSLISALFTTTGSLVG